MIAFIVGTTAELIKIAPVYHELVGRGRSTEIWYSGQHVEELAGTLADLDLPKPEQWLVPESGARNLARPADVPRWAARLAATVFRKRAVLGRRLRSDGTAPVVLVHGDTFTAPIGALVGRILGARVGHVEAGMRSGSLLHPFPEELNRRVAGRLVDLHFPPTDAEAHNLRRNRGAVVTTGANTIIDAVRYALAHPVATPLDLPETYAVATLHRFELVRQENLYREALEILKEYSTRMPIVYFAGASERERLAEYGLLGLFDGTDFRIEDKLSYVAFLPILARARFVVTDSGGLQEESAHLGIPCAVHRVRTERSSGEGVNMVLTGFRSDKLRAFLDDFDRYKGVAALDAYRPSEVIVDAIETLGAPAAR
ncbi:UDP-N-acetylglucosamine 2-epimerase [Cellulomonas sp. NS3]|uniref:UDP-N-acetylglucosamine 2-epimerase n=1 Tax=Cellulomonas sp. NS3 TaxID=2973977 RepID=UPI0021633798|nr:UDP-N-acetylglucosamine 2-epimerase [Cellulomonas sp. NS3]